MELFQNFATVYEGLEETNDLDLQTINNGKKLILIKLKEEKS